MHSNGEVTKIGNVNESVAFSKIKIPGRKKSFLICIVASIPRVDFFGPRRLFAMKQIERVSKSHGQKYRLPSSTTLLSAYLRYLMLHEETTAHTKDANFPFACPFQVPGWTRLAAA